MYILFNVVHSLVADPGVFYGQIRFRFFLETVGSYFFCKGLMQIRAKSIRLLDIYRKYINNKDFYIKNKIQVEIRSNREPDSVFSRGSDPDPVFCLTTGPVEGRIRVSNPVILLCKQLWQNIFFHSHYTQISDTCNTFPIVVYLSTAYLLIYAQVVSSNFHILFTSLSWTRLFGHTLHAENKTNIYL